MSWSLTPTFSPRFSSCAGLTLVELMTVVSVLAILASLSLPSLRAVGDASALRSATAEFLSALQVARSDAMRLGRRVTVCRSLDQATCDTSTTGGWESGWLVFIDADRGNSSDAQVSPGDIITLRHGPITGRMRVRGNSPVDQFVSYASSGLGRTMGGGMLAGTLRVCSTSPALSDGVRAVDLVLSASGRVIAESPGSIDATCPKP